MQPWTLLVTMFLFLFIKELTADKSRLDEVNADAARLITEGHSGEHIIREHQTSLDERFATYMSTGSSIHQT